MTNMQLFYNYIIIMIRFNWDSNKAKRNLSKHGISFEEAKSMFFDDHARLIPDPDNSFEEERFLILGISQHSNVLIVSHCYRESDENIRIISARKADKHERKQYEGFRYARTL